MEYRKTKRRSGGRRERGAGLKRGVRFGRKVGGREEEEEEEEEESERCDGRAGGE
jgi:hypothetical protein